jgi:tetratricopeptide (TPR) repeat protein
MEVIAIIIGAFRAVISALTFWKSRKKKEAPSNQAPPTGSAIPPTTPQPPGAGGIHINAGGDVKTGDIKTDTRGDTINTNSHNPFTLNNYGTIIQQISQDKSVPLEALRGILERMGEKELDEADPDPAKIEQLLRAWAERYLSLEKKLQVLEGDDPEVQRLREAARQALREEDRLLEVEELLRQARERVHAIGETAYATWRKQEAEIASEQASAAQLQVNPTAYRKAADLFGEAARLVVDDAHKARKYQFHQAFVLQSLGDEFGDNDALREAIALYRQILSGIDRATDPLDWAAIQNNLGRGLFRLGEREGDTARLHEAIAAYRAALEEYTRERVPLNWASTQSNLGLALQTLGERESDTKLLEEAIAAHHAALTVYEASGASYYVAIARRNLTRSKAAPKRARKD